jgi:hypothetical protein
MTPELLPPALAAKVSVGRGPDPCWYWHGNGLGVSSGYGAIYWNGRSQQAHRVVYEELVAPIREGLVLDHLCQVKHCVNPMHLDPCTRVENTRRAHMSRFCRT